MKTKIIPFILVTIAILRCLAAYGYGQGLEIFQKGFLGEQPYLKVIPDLDNPKLKDDETIIACKVTNDYSEDIRIELPMRRTNGLAVLADSGVKRGIEMYLHGGAMGSGISFPVILKPGASGTFNSYSPTKDLQLLQGKGKMVYAEVTGQIVRTGGFFHSYSAPFTISPNLITPPWSDLGEKDYLAVAPDLEHIFFSAPMTAEDKTRDPTWSAGPAVTIEVKITNTTGQSIIAANDSIVFYVERGAAIRKAPSQWETIRPPGRLLMPGASTLSTGRCYINWIDWAEMNYKSGDKIVAAVGGRIPNTNQIFECYSAPFELPPLPNPHPTPKPAFSIPGIQ